MNKRGTGWRRFRAVPALIRVIVILLSALLLRTFCSTSTMSSALNHASSQRVVKNYSLWLLPQKEDAMRIQSQIDALAENRGPSFAPHITVVGGIKCESEEQALDLARKLQEGLKGFGEIFCKFDISPYAAEGVWNQALCLTMDISEPFSDLCHKSRVILNEEYENWTFPPPVGVPHLSLFYGTSGIPPKDKVEPVSSFYSHTLALWQTYPPTLDGVPEWKEIAVIELQ